MKEPTYYEKCQLCGEKKPVPCWKTCQDCSSLNTEQRKIAIEAIKKSKIDYRASRRRKKLAKAART